MSRDLFGLEKGIAIYDTDGDVSVAEILQGAALPGGDGGEQDAAPQPSLYFRTGTSEIYRKIAGANATSDWELIGGVTAPDQTFREESVRVVTGDVFGVGARDIGLNPFTDDEAPLITVADFVVGDHIIVGQGTGSPALYEVTALPGGNVVTFAAAATPLAEGNNFVAKNYLPDSPDSQEGQALIHYNGTDIVKLGDIDWAFATGINLSAGYVAASGNVTAGDTVEAAIAKLDGVNDNQDTLLGTAQGDTDLGTFTGSTISDNTTVVGALQELETAVEAAAPTTVGPADIAQNIATVVDEVDVNEFQSTEWIVTAHDIGTPSRVKVLKIMGVHNGAITGLAPDASTVKDNVYVKMKTGNFNLQANAVLNGVGAAQRMQLVLETSDAAGIRYTVSRAETTPAL